LTAALALRGLNSLDAVLEGDKVWILELNPRLSATFNLYPNLLNAHIQGSKGEFVDIPKNNSAKAEFVLYAKKQLIIPADFIWPDWVADIPYMGAAVLKLDENVPICTVLAEAEDATSAHQLVLDRVEKLKRKLFHD
jgi:predicted ATP-grasp superfamily ATP-dependent carboligase